MNLERAMSMLMTYGDWQIGHDAAEGLYYCDIFEGDRFNGTDESLVDAILAAVAKVKANIK